MKTAILFLLVVIIAFAALYVTGALTVQPNTVDLRISDTAVAMEPASFAVLAGWIAGLFFSIGGLIGTRFRNRFFVILFLLVLAAGAFIFYQYIYR